EGDQPRVIGHLHADTTVVGLSAFTGSCATHLFLTNSPSTGTTPSGILLAPGTLGSGAGLLRKNRTCLIPDSGSVLTAKTGRRLSPRSSAGRASVSGVLLRTPSLVISGGVPSMITGR